MADGRLVDIGDTQLYIVERGQGYPLIVLHGGPGLDHHMFGDYLDALTDHYRLILVDQRSQGLSPMTPDSTWTIPQMAQDVVSLAQALGLNEYAVLGHSFGAMVALQNAVDFPGAAAQTIVSSGVPSASKYLGPHVQFHIENFEPLELREQVAASWERETIAQTQEDVASLLTDQFPYHFRDPFSPLIQEMWQRTVGAVYAPDVLRHFSTQAYGGIEVEDQLGHVTQPVLVLAGRYDRACSIPAAEAIATGIPNAQLVIFENSGHMTYIEENERYLRKVRQFLDRG
ncbi:MAG: amino acid amidase [Chloroflexota bacterium]|nr:alpha/beta fold hydrolase [Chloroflexota bacterium]NOG64526.1 alpha/beta fold hydrolase [Chloroflexota bacterium]GIK66074.1 MAG: amino acid amidase [Chloroflexota bacterium]